MCAGSPKATYGGTFAFLTVSARWGLLKKKPRKS
jgi:hypothetical protein